MGIAGLYLHPVVVAVFVLDEKLWGLQVVCRLYISYEYMNTHKNREEKCFVKKNYHCFHRVLRMTTTISLNTVFKKYIYTNPKKGAHIFQNDKFPWSARVETGRPKSRPQFMTQRGQSGNALGEGKRTYTGQECRSGCSTLKNSQVPGSRRVASVTRKITWENFCLSRRGELAASWQIFSSLT